MFDLLKKATFSVWTRKLWVGRWKVLVFMMLFLMTSYSALFVIPIRNVVLYHSLEFAWKDLPTDVLFRIHFVADSPPESIYAAVTCLNLNAPRIKKEDINTSAILTYSYLKSYDAQVLSLKNGHGRYLPALNLSQKVDNLYLYKVAAEALDQVGVRHFLVAGSLLGLKRHGGFVPWDDDLDIGVASVHWKVVKKTLSCIEGFRIWQKLSYHWKFLYTNMSNPFVDIFFYQMDNSYVWADNSVTRRTFIYPTHLVFPLTEDVFEGVRVPVPRDSLALVKRIYDYDVCAVYAGHILRSMICTDQYPYGHYVKATYCKDLSYMYDMQDIS